MKCPYRKIITRTERQIPEDSFTDPAVIFTTIVEFGDCYRKECCLYDSFNGKCRRRDKE